VTNEPAAAVVANQKDLAMIGNKRPVGERPGGDRRAERRYGLRLDVAWKLMHGSRVLAGGSGRTRDLARHGVRFEADPHVAVGKSIELSISWPVLLHNAAPVRLVVAGRVVRYDGTCAAVSVRRYEFRPSRRSADPLAAAFQGAAVGTA